MTTGEVKEYTFEELCQIIGTIVTDYSMKYVHIFGFRIRNDNTADSDYDFFVVLNNDCKMFRLIGFFCKLEEVLDDMDIICSDPAEERALRIRSPRK